MRNLPPVIGYSFKDTLFLSMNMMTDDLSPTTTQEAPAEATATMAPEAPVAPEAVADAPISAPVEETSSAEATPAPEPEVAVAPEPQPDAPAPVAETVVEPVAAVAPAAPAKPAAPAASDEDLFAAAMAELDGGASVSESYRKLSKGDRIEATVIQVERDRVFVDLGTKSEGVVPLSELSTESLETAEGQVQVGDKINVIVIKPAGSGEDYPIVSKKKADFEEVWYGILDKHQSGETIQATVINRVKGGLEVDLGVRGFVPATHVGNGKLRNIEKYVGQVIELKIIEVDRERKKVVLSNRLAEEEKRESVKGEIFGKAKAGDILDGVVRRLTDYGAFVDLGGVDGLLHISEMSWMRINHPKEVLKEGQELKVMVLRLDEGTGKISLGLRQVLPDPWKLIRENYKIGQKITCSVGRLVTNGVFVKLPEGAEAFLPVSEISNKRIAKPGDVLTDNQEIEVAVIDLRPDERRMVLSMRSAGSAIDPPAGYDPGPMTYESDRDRNRGGGGGRGGKKRGGGRDRGGYDDFEPQATTRAPSGGATIGERLGMLKGLLRPDDDSETEGEN